MHEDNSADWEGPWEPPTSIQEDRWFTKPRIKEGDSRAHRNILWVIYGFTIIFGVAIISTMFVGMFMVPFAIAYRALNLGLWPSIGVGVVGGSFWVYWAVIKN